MPTIFTSENSSGTKSSGQRPPQCAEAVLPNMTAPVREAAILQRNRSIAADQSTTELLALQATPYSNAVGQPIKGDARSCQAFVLHV
ncbi:hypothetical protein [Paraburkholderia mimosarum]|uniref:hypothetical protein n=1 Tax=Paraburkholderia mimosarum TaxID=312026 RepID=UPI0012B549DC|nr:hypothetical protein [Paraburkholderia mimosarum]